MRQNDIALISRIAELTGLAWGDVLSVFYGEAHSQDVNTRVFEALRVLEPRDKPSMNALARPSIGIIAPGFFVNDFVGLLFQGINEAAHALGYNLTLHAQTPGSDHGDLSRYYGALFENKYADDGFILLTAQNSEISIQLCRDYRYPFVLCDCDANDSKVKAYSRICIDNRTAMKDVVNYLIRLGHQRIGFITGQLTLPPAIERLQGYREALAEAGLPVDEALIVEGDWQIEAGTEQMRVLLQQSVRPTAVIASNDLMALGAITAIVEAGLHLPDDISLVGFDDIEMASMVSPRLTTVRQPLVEMGTGAVEMLDTLLRDRVLPVQSRCFGTLLIIRELTRPPRRSR